MSKIRFTLIDREEYIKIANVLEKFSGQYGYRVVHEFILQRRLDDAKDALDGIKVNTVDDQNNLKELTKLINLTIEKHHPKTDDVDTEDLSDDSKNESDSREMIDIEVTQEIIDANPDGGLVLGETVQVPAVLTDEEKKELQEALESFSGEGDTAEQQKSTEEKSEESEQDEEKSSPVPPQEIETSHLTDEEKAEFAQHIEEVKEEYEKDPSAFIEPVPQVEEEVKEEAAKSTSKKRGSRKKAETPKSDLDALTDASKDA